MNLKNEKLKKARENKDLTQVEIAKRVGISPTSYQRIEYGIQRPSLDTAMLIAKALDTTVEILWSCNSKDSL